MDTRAMTGGNIVVPDFPAPRLVWVAEHEPQILDRAAKVLRPKKYLTLWLMDICARGSKPAAAIIDNGGLAGVLKNRYSGWGSPQARAMPDSNFDAMFARVLSGGINPKPRSGSQESRENYGNRFV